MLLVPKSRSKGLKFREIEVSPCTIYAPATRFCCRNKKEYHSVYIRIPSRFFILRVIAGLGNEEYTPMSPNSVVLWALCDLPHIAGSHIPVDDRRLNLLMKVLVQLPAHPFDLKEMEQQLKLGIPRA
ncbi:hypothetical protein Leryth_001253 [Lithospermum erythrorhizon]|nr:hypothetical protein Leryth_001253 [Lithospermum erythrorhizon]